MGKLYVGRAADGYFLEMKDDGERSRWRMMGGLSVRAMVARLERLEKEQPVLRLDEAPWA